MTMSPRSISPVTALLSAKELICGGGLGKCMRQIWTRDPEAEWCTPLQVVMSAKHSPLTEIQVSATSDAINTIENSQSGLNEVFSDRRTTYSIFKYHEGSCNFERIFKYHSWYKFLIALPFIRLPRLIVVNLTLEQSVHRRLLFLPSLPNPTPLYPTRRVNISLSLRSRRTQDTIEVLWTD